MCMMVILAQNWWSGLNLWLFKLMLDNTNPYLKALMAKCELSHWSFALLIYTYQKSYNGSWHMGLLTTGLNQTIRHLHSISYSIHKAWLISCLDLPNTWAHVKYSTNMFQSDTCFFITLKQQRQDLRPLDLPYLHFTGTPLSLLHRWSGGHFESTYPQSGVKIKMAPSLPLFLITLPKHANILITSHQCQISPTG